ncbi:MAG TPA: mycofactocin biosynthesis glycosyltransferase MftF [Acidimicrobiales bacterium]|nr:mycofactocin biosynthesis glycosyltransferase MftF [Acidimicrobiales bacterium]
MSAFLPTALPPTEAPIPEGTRVSFDEHATFLDRDLVSGGSPWRLLRLTSPSFAVATRWRTNGVVRAGEERFARTLVQQGLLHPHFEVPLAMDQIDVVVPVYEDVESLATLLGNLVGFHVIVVDDGSRNAVAIARCVEEFDATLVRLPVNHGPAFARNKGALASARPFLWFVDVDIELGDPRDIARSLHNEFADPLVAATAPRVRGAAGPTKREQFEHHFGALDMGGFSGLVVPGGPVSYVPSACLMVRRTSFGDGFDEFFRVGEDVDFVWRLFDKGWLVRYQAGAVVGHRARTSWRSWFHQRHGYGESTAALASRHGARLAPLRADTWTMVAWASVLVGHPTFGARIVNGARRHARDKFFSQQEAPDDVATKVVAYNMMRAGGPLARAVVRTFGVVVLLSALHPRLRARALALFAVGTLWRWRHERLDLRDVPLAIVDDLAYGTGVFHGAWRAKSLQTLSPTITKSELGLREVLGVARETTTDN